MRTEVQADSWIPPFAQGAAELRGVGALMSTRVGGASPAPWDSLNLGTAVGDEPARVAHNRAVFAQALGVVPVFLKQVHGTHVLRLLPQHAALGAEAEEADACVSTELGLACTVQVADCLPALFAAPEGRAVGAAHAGWRGLAAGVLESTLHAVCEAAACAPCDVHVWLGACIGPRHFEVGAEVREAFVGSAHCASAFVPTHAGKWLADLPQLARLRLASAGVVQISGNQSEAEWCTFANPSRYFSFRRDGVTGRMAAAIWRVA